jgi:membrane dipeptidase
VRSVGHSRWACAALGSLALVACASSEPRAFDAAGDLESHASSDFVAEPVAAASTSAPSASAVGAASAHALGSANAQPSASAPRGAPRPIDMHVDTPYQVHFKGRAASLPEGQATSAMLRAAGYEAVVYPIYIPDYLNAGKPRVSDAEAIAKTLDAIIGENPLLWPASKGPAPEGKVLVLQSIEGAGAFADEVEAIDRFVARGVRFVGPVHARDNRLATSATGDAQKKKPNGAGAAGLSEIGARFCERVYAQGALVDVSHMSDAAFDDLAELAGRVGAPIVATHSNSRSVADHPRNLTDEQLRRIAKSGGVAGLNFHAGFLARGREATLDDVVRHAQHMIAVAGIDHVGLGSDFDGATPPSDLADASRLPALAAALRRSGLSEEDVHKIYGDNVKRVLAWRPR